MKEKLPTKRAKQLAAKFTSSPVFPVLGWTKVVETVVASGPTVNWTAYAVVVTLVWIYADDVQRHMDAAVDAAEDAVDAADRGEQ